MQISILSQVIYDILLKKLANRCRVRYMYLVIIRLNMLDTLQTHNCFSKTLRCRVMGMFFKSCMHPDFQHTTMNADWTVRFILSQSAPVPRTQYSPHKSVIVGSGNNSSGLSGGGIAGIIIAVLIILVAVMAGMLLWRRRMTQGAGAAPGPSGIDNRMYFNSSETKGDDAEAWRGINWNEECSNLNVKTKVLYNWSYWKLNCG